ncbi:MAG: cytochrome c peroxidase [Planctomycetota bacterium]
MIQASPFPRLLLRAAPALLLLSSVQAQERAHMWDLPSAPMNYADPEVPVAIDRDRLARNTPTDNQVTDWGASLGRVLFYDVRLSRNERTSCASCHKQAKGFADGQRHSRGFERKPTRRNSMSLANLAYYQSGRFFWDERGATLEEMVLMPIQDEVEMGMDLATLVDRVAGDPGYRELFRKAFGDPEVSKERIGKALAQFLRSMVSFRSRFDEGYARTGSVVPDFPNFSRAENLGKRIFLGLHDGNTRNSCASCHMLSPEPIQPSMCGDQPTATTPRKTRGLQPVLFQAVEPLNNGIDDGDARDDPGLSATTGFANDTGRFKAPSLRNVAVTGPYMHDGRFPTLARVLDHYSRRIQPHPNLDKRLQGNGQGSWGGQAGRRSGPTTPSTMATIVSSATTPSKKEIQPGAFNFESGEKQALIAFLRTLTDDKFLKDERWSDPFR